LASKRIAGTHSTVRGDKEEKLRGPVDLAQPSKLVSHRPNLKQE